MAEEPTHPLVKLLRNQRLEDLRLPGNPLLAFTKADMQELALCLIAGSGYAHSGLVSALCYLPLEALAWAETQQAEGGYDGVGNAEQMLKLAKEAVRQLKVQGAKGTN